MRTSMARHDVSLENPASAVDARPAILPVGIVVPAHNEERHIGACLASVTPFFEHGDPVVVVDARSTDATARISNAHGAAVVTSDDPSRAAAVRAGYERIAADVSIVVVAHADMRFPPPARSVLLDAMAAHPRAPGAYFGHRIDDSRRRFRWIERGNRLRAGLLGVPYGDQAMALRTDAVAATGGFPHAAALEDLELAIRLRSRGRWLDLNCPVTIDARHWESGVVRTTIRNWRTALAYVAAR